METVTLPLAQLAEVGLRAGAASISLLVTVLLLSNRPLRAVSVFGALFLTGAAVYAVMTIEPVHSMLGVLHLPLELFAVLAPAFFWLFIIALFDDNFRFRPWMAGPPLFMATLFLACVPYPALQSTNKMIQFAVVLSLMAHIVVLTRRNLGDDLVASRRRFTNIIALLIPLVCLCIAIIEIYELFDMQSEIGRQVISVILFVVKIVFALSVASIRKSLLPDLQNRSRPSPSSHPAADRFDLARLEDLMKDGVFLHPGLTIGELANRMNMPEHRLRRLINNGLGYRNFAAFINDHRIEEAKRRLSEPATARDQITGLAFDLGYSSLAPFNRAFRERIGMSPSQYREKTLAGI